MHDSEKISEQLLFYVWKNQLFDKNNLTDQNNNKISVIKTGILNNDAGPDFFNAKIKIGETTWVGNVEIHYKSSDWKLHKHNVNKAYDNVILHVVIENDIQICTTKGEEISTCKLKLDKNLTEKYYNLLAEEKTILCSSEIKKIDDFTVNLWLERLIIERIEQKTKKIELIFEYTNKNWNETFYIALANAFGMKINSLAFEMLAKSLPLNILAKHKDNIFQLEALFFGVSGMLDSDIEDEYFKNLKKEFHFLKKKYKLNSLEPHLWKFLRLRPVNFPTIRISQFADLINKSSQLFSKIIEEESLEKISEMFDIQTSEYWQKHYTFGKESKKKTKNFGKVSRNSVIINMIVPLIFLYGKLKSKPEISERAIAFLEQMKPESNKITKEWKNLGFEIENSYKTQALIQLYNEYCVPEKCLDCQIGNKIIK